MINLFNNEELLIDIEAKLEASKELVYKQDVSSHTNYFKVNNTRAISPSTMLKQVYCYKFDDIPEFILNEKAKIGTMTHDFAEMTFHSEKEITIQDVIKKYDPLNEWSEDYLKKIIPYLTGMKEWLSRDLNYVWMGSEVLVASQKYQMAGIIDAILFDKKTNQLVIGDFKTSATIDMKLQPLQLAMYALICNDLLGYDLFQKGVLIQITNNGSFIQHEFSIKDYEEKSLRLIENYKIFQV